MLLGVDQRLHLALAGLARDDIAPLASAIGAPPLSPDALQRLYDGTSGHALYLRTVLSDLDNLGRLGASRLPVPPSLAAAIGDQLALLPAETRSLLEMLSVVDAPMPLALLGQAAEVASPSAAIEAAVRAGLVDLSDEGPSWPVVIRHALRARRCLRRDQRQPAPRNACSRRPSRRRERGLGPPGGLPRPP